MIIFIFLGIVSSIFQLTILREFIFSIAKNEFSFVVATGIWFIFCSLGSLAGRKKNLLSFSYVPFSFSLVFCLTISAVHLAKSLVSLGYYETVSLGFVFLSSFILIGPLSFLIGFSFCIFSKRYLDRCAYSPEAFAKFFAYEAIGFFIGGVIFTFFLSSCSNPFLFTILPLLFLIVFDSKKNRKVFSALIIISLGLVFVLSFKFILKKEFKDADILINKGSHYGPIILAKKFGVESLYVNGSLAASSEDKAWNEKLIHTCFSAAKDIKKVLFIGSYFSGQVQEILKYDITHFDCLDINPVLSKLNKERVIKAGETKVNFIINDPRFYIKNTHKKYDCIIMSMPAPSSLSFNRYFSYEFFRFVKKRLAENGIFCFYIPSKRDILSPHILKFNSSIINTLDRVFKNRLLIPSDSMIIIAADTKSVRPANLIKRFSKLSVETDYFTIYHLKDCLDSGRIKYVENMINKKIQINSDFYPMGFLYYILLEQAKFYPDLSIDIQKAKPFIIGSFIVIVLLAGFLSLLKKKISFLLNAGVTGFLSIGLTAIIFMLFQLYSGALFWKMGILTGVFMAGLSSGAFLVNLVVKKMPVGRRILSCFYFVWVFFLLSLLIGIKTISRFYCFEFIFYIYSFFSGVITGAVYPLLARLMLDNKIGPKNIAVSIYAADLTGAFLGTFIFSVFFIPFLGITFSLILLVVLTAFFALKTAFG